MRERVKLALRHGVMLNRIPMVDEAEDGAVVGHVVVFVDEAYQYLYIQDAANGQVSELFA
jgi:hypothetical protein